MITQALRYCILTNHCFVAENIDLVGFYQWHNVFNGKILRADDILPELKDNDFDIIHIRLSRINADLITQVRNQIGDNSNTKIVACIDIPTELWKKEFPKLSKLRENITKADFIYATEYTICQSIEKLICKPVYEIPHPADLKKIKALKQIKKEKKLTILVDKLDRNYNILYQISIKLFRLKPQIVIYNKSISTNDLKRVNKIDLIVCRDEKELCKILSESELVVASYTFKNYGKLVIYAAALGCFLIGNYNRDALRRCYPSSVFDFKDTRSFLFQYSWLRKENELREFIIENAVDKVEYYNWGNLKKKYLDLLFKETKHNKFNYHFQDKIDIPENIVFCERINHVHGKRHVKYNQDEFVVVCLVRDGIEYLNAFLNHYRILGAKHFYFIDNYSTDGTVSYLKQFDDVTIYETSLLHKKYECEIRQTIIEEHCKDRWCLNVDIDEFFDHPFSNILSMKELLTYLKKKNYTSVVANMLDMFAKETEFSESKINTDLLNKYCYYDISHLQNNKYFSKFKVYCLYNSLADKRMKYYYGGIRDTLFKTPSSRYLLVKHPLIYVNGKLEPVTNPHFCNKANIADITCLLRHYKLTASFKSKVQNLRDDLVYFAQKEYDAYNNVIKDTNSLNLNSKTMVKFKHVNELIENNFLKVSDQYLEFFNLKTKSIDMFTALKQLFAGKKTTSYLDTFPPDKDLPYKVMLYWYISNTCNFSCPQCAGHAVILKKKYAPERIKIRELKKFLKGFDYKIRISFTGGEPFIVKNINKIFSEITKEHYISLVTNLVSPAVKKFARTIDPGRVQFVVASAHMIELEKRGLLNTFLNNCTLLLNKGFNLEVTEVAYPFIVDKVAGYKKVFEDIGIKLRFFAFRGTWKNKQYPNSYTDEEIKLFNLDNSLETSPDIFNRKGNLCNAGHNIAVMMNNLEIQPCFSIEKNIGSMSKGVVFNKNLIRCPVENCGCPFFAFEPILYNMAVEETCPKQEVLVDSVI